MQQHDIEEHCMDFIKDGLPLHQKALVGKLMQNVSFVNH